LYDEEIGGKAYIRDNIKTIIERYKEDPNNFLIKISARAACENIREFNAEVARLNRMINEG
jgi:hypothetical protein